MSASIFFFLCCILTNVCVGLYVVEVQLFGYDNPTGRCYDQEECVRNDGQHSCCDAIRTNDCTEFRRCDSYFIYCLRPLGSNGEGCSNYRNRTSMFNREDNPLDFSQSVVLGLENPLLLEGITETYERGIQVYIEVQDRDTNLANAPDDLVDTVLIDHTLAVGESTQRQTFNGRFDFVTIDLNITVLCVENFQEPDCTQCVTGFTGPDCQTNIDDCVGAQNCSERGQCVDGVNSFTCVCSPGYSGTVCEIQDLVPTPEAGRGSMGAIIGGAVGGLVATIILAVLLVVLILLTIRCLNHKKGKTRSRSDTVGEGRVRDNPIYGTESDDNKKIDNVYSVPFEKPETEEHEKMDKGYSVLFEKPELEPTAGDHENINEGYSVISDKAELEPSHKFENPIYGDQVEPEGNTYSVPYDSSRPTHTLS